jgi:hypothetical protein
MVMPLASPETVDGRLLSVGLILGFETDPGTDTGEERGGARPEGQRIERLLVPGHGEDRQTADVAPVTMAPTRITPKATPPRRVAGRWRRVSGRRACPY